MTKKKQLSQHDQEQNLPGQHTIYVLTSKLHLVLKGQTLNLVTHVTLGLKVLLEKKTLINNSSLIPHQSGTMLIQIHVMCALPSVCGGYQEAEERHPLVL